MTSVNHYEYDGPVMIFDTCVAHRWKGETSAKSEAKARSNLTFQFKRDNNMSPATKVSLPGKLRMVG